MLKTTDLQSLKKHFEVKTFRKGEVVFPSRANSKWSLCCNKRPSTFKKKT